MHLYLSWNKNKQKRLSGYLHTPCVSMHTHVFCWQQRTNELDRDRSIPQRSWLPPHLFPFKGQFKQLPKNKDSLPQEEHSSLDSCKTGTHLILKYRFFPDSSHLDHKAFKSCWVNFYSEFRLKVFYIPHLPHSLRKACQLVTAKKLRVW